MLSLFDTILACDRQTHAMTAYTVHTALAKRRAVIICTMTAVLTARFNSRANLKTKPTEVTLNIVMASGLMTLAVDAPHTKTHRGWS